MITLHWCGYHLLTCICTPQLIPYSGIYVYTTLQHHLIADSDSAGVIYSRYISTSRRKSALDVDLCTTAMLTSQKSQLQPFYSPSGSTNVIRRLKNLGLHPTFIKIWYLEQYLWPVEGFWYHTSSLSSRVKYTSLLPLNCCVQQLPALTLDFVSPDLSISHLLQLRINHFPSRRIPKYIAWFRIPPFSYLD